MSEKDLPSQKEDNKHKKDFTEEEFDRRRIIRREFKTNREEATVYQQSMTAQLARMLGVLQKMVKPAPTVVAQPH